MQNYDRLICHYKRPNGHEVDDCGKTLRRNAILINSDVVPSAPYFTMTWYCQAMDPKTATHVHDFDEYIGFVGSDPSDPENLNGVVKFMIDDTWVTMTKSTILFIPAGTKHCPYTVEQVDKPIIHFSGTGESGLYIKQEK